MSAILVASVAMGQESDAWDTMTKAPPPSDPPVVPVCQEAPKPPVKPQKRNKKKPVAKAVVPPPVCATCADCPDAVACPAPVVVEKIVTVVKTVPVEKLVLVQPTPFKSRFAFGIGYMADVTAPAHIYMWQQGANVQIRFSMTPLDDVFLNVGAGIGMRREGGPGHWNSIRAQAGYESFFKAYRWLGLSASLYATNVGIDDGRDAEVFLGVVPGLVARAHLGGRFNWVTQMGLLVGAGIGQRYGTELSLGPVASTNILYTF